MSFKDLKKNSSDFSKLQSELEKQNKSNDYKDDRMWRPILDAASNGYAVIRFLPAVQGEDIPWVKTYQHAFRGKGGWFINNCPTTLGQKCPVCEGNNELWNSGTESDKNIARDRKRKLTYTSNILIVEDPASPQNKGKVFLFKYGKKIFDKIQEQMNPEFADESTVNPFDFWKGANFKLKVRKVEGYVNYDKSEFSAASAVFDGDDAKIEALWNSQYPLKPFVDPKEFKSYAELKVKLVDALGGDLRSEAGEEDTFESDTKARQGTRSGRNAPKQETEDVDVDTYLKSLGNE
jgi:gp32 DNA binding protein like